MNKTLYPPDLRYKATTRYSAGWTDPKGIFGSPEPTPFGEEPNHATLKEVNSIKEQDLENLWMLRFPEPPTMQQISEDPFFLVLAYKWWNTKKLTATYNAFDGKCTYAAK